MMGQVREIKKHKEEIMEERKIRNFYICGGSHTCVFSMGRNAFRLLSLCDLPS